MLKSAATLLLFTAMVIVGVLLNGAGRQREIFRSVCDLTEAHFYKAGPRLDDWLFNCRLRAARFPSRASRADLQVAIQDQLNEMQVSHFQIYDPRQDRQIWKGESVDTGVRARYVEDLLVVYKILPDSPADDVGLRVGDVIVEIEGTEQVTPWGAMRRSGRFRIRRGQEEFDSALVPRTLVEDSHPRLRDLGGGTGWLEIPSFRAEFFERDAWIKIARAIGVYRNLIVDLRENSGGNFVAMLRALSAFHCAPHAVGAVVQPRKDLPRAPQLADELADVRQLEALDQFGQIGLRTFPGYPCYRGRVTVLVGPETSSVSEIFADDMRVSGARVWGLPTAGDVVLAVWYDLPQMGPGFSMSIPQAVYQTADGRELEGAGVYPQRELFYDLKHALQGRDSWLEKAKGY